MLDIVICITLICFLGLITTICLEAARESPAVFDCIVNTIIIAGIIVGVYITYMCILIILV